MGLSFAIPDALLGVAMMHPSQFFGKRCERAVGPRALLLRLLADALHQADLGPRIRRQGPVPNASRPGATRARRAQVDAARRWLVGDLDDQVALPIGFVCDALGLDAARLAAVVRARSSRRPVLAPPSGRRQVVAVPPGAPSAMSA
jgi:hypothetical protein